MADTLEPMDTSIQIKHLTSYDWTMYESHFHAQYELNLSISGGNRFFINDTIHEATKGDLFILNDNDLHKNIVPIDQPYERYLINFPPSVLEAISSDQCNLLELFSLDRSSFRNKLTLNNENLLELTSLIDDTIYHYKSYYYYNQTYLQIKLAEILLVIHRIYHENRSSKAQVTNHKFQKTQQIVDYLNTHLDEDLSLEALSKVFYMNRTYLCDKFKADTGFTINQYLTSRRILRSRELLAKDLTVTQVAKSVGYDNDSHFIRLFKKLIGVTPKQYAISLRQTSK